MHQALLFDLFLHLLIVEGIHELLSHFSYVFANFHRVSVLFVEMLTIHSHLLEKELRGLLIDVVECRLMGVVFEDFWQVCRYLHCFVRIPTNGKLVYWL